jgi:hypothetical protein
VGDCPNLAQGDSFFQKSRQQQAVPQLCGLAGLKVGGTLTTTGGVPPAVERAKPDDSHAKKFTTEPNRIQLVLLGMQNRTLGSYLAANNRILV